jgi:hypothetical protein
MNRHYRLLTTFGFGFLFLLAAGLAIGSPALQNRGRDPNRLEAIPIVISSYGFPYKSFSLPAGPYAFVLFNRSGFHSVTVYLERMPGHAVDGPAARQEFLDRVGGPSGRVVKNARLTPGTYRIRVEGRPAWIAAIEVN